MKFINLHATESTNTYLADLLLKKPLFSPTIVRAHTQHAGRGQQGNTWKVMPGKNLTFSIYQSFEGVFSKDSFRINLAVVDALLSIIDQYVDKACAKWPNDIMAGEKKLGGILIENRLTSDTIKHSIIGIGLNVNQDVFSDSINATSLKLLTNTEYDLEVLCSAFAKAIVEKLNAIPETSFESQVSNYCDRLLGFEEYRMYQIITSGQKINATIQGIYPDGRIVLFTNNNQRMIFGFQEIKLLQFP